MINSIGKTSTTNAKMARQSLIAKYGIDIFFGKPDIANRNGNNNKDNILLTLFNIAYETRIP